MQGAQPVPDADLAEQRQIVQAFLTAAREGDFAALLELFDPEVTLRVDAGPNNPLSKPPVVGREAVLAEARRFAALSPYGRPAIVNGVAGGIAERPDGSLFAVVAVTVRDGKITTLDFILDPAKLARVSH